MYNSKRFVPCKALPTNGNTSFIPVWELEVIDSDNDWLSRYCYIDPATGKQVTGYEKLIDAVWDIVNKQVTKPQVAEYYTPPDFQVGEEVYWEYTSHKLKKVKVEKINYLKRNVNYNYFEYLSSYDKERFFPNTVEELSGTWQLITYYPTYVLEGTDNDVDSQELFKLDE